MIHSSEPVARNKSLRRLWLIAYLGIGCVFLAVLVVFVWQYFGNDFNVPAARMKIREIVQACKQYQLDHSGQSPSSLEALLLTDEDGKGPYLKREAIIDPWKNKFKYDPSGAKHTGPLVLVPDIYCVMPDGRTIGNWDGKER